MVRPVKRGLKMILLGASIAFEELYTGSRELELTLNNRPYLYLRGFNTKAFNI